VSSRSAGGDIDPASSDPFDRRDDQAPRFPNDEFIIEPEVGILHRLRRENPNMTFYPANPEAVCAFMKVTTLPKVRRSLERLEHRITVPAEIAARARLAIERMVAIGGQAPQTPLSPAPAAEDPGE
jgi:quinolinate synthase